ncbi:MAG: hypothetical protein Q8L14_12285 [Myxococcales bacterium]|nr:hypothetical protein [Myxococcales bacterium]
MRRLLSGVVVAGLLLVTGCPMEPPPPPPPPAPPRAFLTLPSNTVIAPTIKGTVTTMGCKKVGQVQLLESGNFLTDARYTGEPTNWEIQPAQLNPIYPVRGFATPLSLSAKVICEEVNTFPDGGFSTREGTSQPISLTFLPVASVRTDMGRQTLPDTFVAEGGVAGQPTTFIGCAGTTTGRALIRVDSNGNIVAFNEGLPFNCDFSSNITDRNPVSGTRWLWMPQVGAFAFDGNLNILSSMTGEITRLSVSPLEGDALITIEDVAAGATKAQMKRIRARPAMMQDPMAWTTLTGIFDTGYPGEFNSDPVVDPGTRRVFTSSWQKRGGSTTGVIAVLVYNYDSGLIVNEPPPAILSFEFPNQGNRPIKPVGAFKEDGTVFYAPLLSVGGGGQLSTTVLACATNVAGCQVSNGSRRWTSPTFQGELLNIVLFSRGNYVGLVGPFATYFLGAGDGAVKNFGISDPREPLRPSGSLITLGVVPGRGNDFFLLNGPIPNGTETTFPTEIIATDAPPSGELWKFAIQGGTQPADSLYLAVDDNGQAWMRVGVDQVRPLGLMEYRNQRGSQRP